jgi:hypothetical protein
MKALTSTQGVSYQNVLIFDDIFIRIRLDSTLGPVAVSSEHGGGTYSYEK